MKKNNSSFGFAVIELLIMIVVIGALAVLIVNFYNSNKQNSIKSVKQAAVDLSLQTDLATAAVQLKVYQVQNDAFPDVLDCNATPAEKSICLKASNGNTYQYKPNNNTEPKSFELIETNTNGVIYHVTNDSVPTLVSAIPTK